MGIGAEVPSDVPFGQPDTMGTLIREHLASKASGAKNSGELRGILDQYGPALDQMGDIELADTLRGALTTMEQAEAARAGVGRVASQDVAGNWQLKKALGEFPSVQGVPGLTPGEAGQVSAIQGDYKRALDALKLSNTGGSQTAQILQNAVPKFGVHGGGMVGRGINSILDTVFRSGNEAVERGILNAILNPQEAARLSVIRQPDTFRELLRKHGLAAGSTAAKQLSEEVK